MKHSLAVKNIRYLVTCDTEDRVLEHVNLYIEDGIIREITERDIDVG